MKTPPKQQAEQANVDLAQDSGGTERSLSMRAATYYRVSSEEQVEAFSIDAQRRACRDFVTAKGHVLVTE
jgi:hypothetical protein